MISYVSLYTAIFGNYKEKNIPVDAPGFYNHSNFLKIEKQHSHYLETYAAFVKKKVYSSDYLRRGCMTRAKLWYLM